MQGASHLHATMFPRSWLSWLPTDEVAARQEMRAPIRLTFLRALGNLLETLYLGQNAGMSTNDQRYNGI